MQVTENIEQSKQIDEDFNKRLDNISLLAEEILQEAKQTNNILNQQNEKLEKIEDKVYDTNNKIGIANRNIRKILSDKNISFINGLSTGAVVSGVTIGTVGILGFGSLPVLGVSLAFTGLVVTGTIVVNKINNVFS